METVEELQKNYGSKKFFGKFLNPDYTGKAYNNEKDDMLFLEVKNDFDKIIDVRYKIFNKPTAFLICEIISQNIVNKKFKDALSFITVENIEGKIGKIPQSFCYVITLFKIALDNIYKNFKINENYHEKPFVKETENETSLKRILNFDFANNEKLSQKEVFEILEKLDGNDFQSLNNLNSKINNTANQKKYSEQKLLKDDVPSFNDYVDNTQNFSFDSYSVNEFNKREKFSDQTDSDFDENNEFYISPDDVINLDIESLFKNKK